MLALTAALMAQQVSAQAGSSATGTAGRSSGSGASPQIGNLGIELIKAGDADYPSAARASWTIPIGRKACSAHKITVTVRNLVGGGTLPYLEAWLGTADNCEKGDRGSRPEGTARCTKLTIPNPDEIQVANRVSYSVTVDIGTITCDSQGERPIYFLQLQSENSNANATSYGVLKLKVDTVLPPTPKDVEGSAGQTVIPMKWTGNTSDTVYYHVLADPMEWTGSTDVDAGPTADGGTPLDGLNAACPSAVLRAGKDIELPFSSQLFTDRVAVGTNSYEFDGTALGTRKKIPAVVVAEDLAGNLSTVSNVVCLDVTRTKGFWDGYTADVPDGAEPGCACSAPGAPGARRSMLIGLPVLLVLGWAGARSRTRRRAR